jgi:hypothetical protein
MPVQLIELAVDQAVVQESLEQVSVRAVLHSIDTN